MKKPLLITFFVLTACAFGVYASLYVPAYLQEKKRYEANQADAHQALAPEMHLTDSLSKRLMQKANELKRRGIKGEERKRLMGLEVKASWAEMNRVRGSHYKSPFDEKPLPLDLKQK